MATLDPKVFDQAAGSPSRKHKLVPSLPGGKAGREWRLTSIARSVRSTTAVLIDAVMGRYDR